MQSSGVIPASGSVLPQTTSVKSAGQNSDVSADSSQPKPGSVQFETQLLVALLNAPQGISMTQDVAGGEALPALALRVPPNVRGLQPGCCAIGSSAGELTPAELEGQSATSLGSNLVSAFGSNGSLSEAEVNQVLLGGGTAPASVLQDMARGIDADWNVLSGGSATMSAVQLEAAIQQYLSVGGANSSA